MHYRDRLVIFDSSFTCHRLSRLDGRRRRPGSELINRSPGRRRDYHSQISTATCRATCVFKGSRSSQSSVEGKLRMYTCGSILFFRKGCKRIHTTRKVSFIPGYLYRSFFGPALNLPRYHFNTGSKFESPQSHFSTGPSHRPVLKCNI